MSSMVATCVPLRPTFRVGNSEKSLGARSGEYGGWVTTGMLFSASNCYTTSDGWLGALSWCRNHFPWYLSRPFLRTAISCREKHSCHHPTTVLSGSRSEWLFAVPYSENGPQGDAFRNHGGHQIECDDRTLVNSKISLPPVLPTKAGSMEQVCVCARVLLWRWFGKRCPMSYHYSAIPQFRELFDCPLICRRFRRIAKSDCQLRRVCPSVSMEQLRSHWMEFHEMWYSSIFWKPDHLEHCLFQPLKQHEWRRLFCNNSEVEVVVREVLYSNTIFKIFEKWCKLMNILGYCV